MFSMIRTVFTEGDLAIWPTTGLVILFTTLIAITVYVFRPKSGAHYSQLGKIILDEDEVKS